MTYTDVLGMHIKRMNPWIYKCNMTQLAVMIRMVFWDYKAEAEILTILLWEARTRREDIYPTVKCFVATITISLNKLSLLTIDGAPAMIVSKNWFIALWKNDDITPKLIALYYCTSKFSVLKFFHLSRYWYNHMNSDHH